MKDFLKNLGFCGENVSLENENVRSFLSELYLKNKLDLDELYLKTGIYSEDILKIVAQNCALDFVDFLAYDKNLCQKISFEMLNTLQILPLKADENHIHIASSKPLSLGHLEELQNIFRDKFIKNVLIDHYKLKKHLNLLRIAHSIQILSTTLKEELETSTKEDEEPTVSKLLNFILSEAIALDASDVHIEGEKDNTVVRFRLGGLLSPFCVLESAIYQALVLHIKFIAHLNITDSIRPQDGTLERSFNGVLFDFRIATLPILWGESVVIRILKHDDSLLDLDKLTFLPAQLQLLKRKIHSPHGMILITGPTGSGKSTTMYACINALKSTQKKIITAEDPIEYKLPSVQQIKLNPKAGLDFSTTLRAILRQDPDVIMIGEIRDEESLDIAVKSALTGHLLFSTLHTNDALSTLERLVDMGAKSYLIASALRLIIAQRLIRTLCPHCKRKSYKSYEGFKGDFYEAPGCFNCRYSGFLGRELVVEILDFDEDLRDKIRSKAPRSELLAYARKIGFMTMFECALSKARQGLISLEELLRVLK